MGCIALEQDILNALDAVQFVAQAFTFTAMASFS